MIRYLHWSTTWLDQSQQENYAFQKNIIANLNISAKHPRFMITALMKQENVMLLQQKKSKPNT